jgi:uncharacterized protein YcfJ
MDCWLDFIPTLMSGVEKRFPRRKVMKIRITALAAALLSAGLAHAGGVTYQYAPVVDVKPQYQTVRTPVDRQVCWEEQSYERAPGTGQRSHTSTVVGAIIGGVIGNQFGGGNGKRAATAAGAALGGSIGRDIGRQNSRPAHYYPVTEERCTVQRDYQSETVINGYQVTYRHNGRLHTTHMNQHPGDRIRLQVSAVPVH